MFAHFCGAAPPTMADFRLSNVMSPNAELGREVPWHIITECFHHPDTKGIKNFRSINNSKSNKIIRK